MASSGCDTYLANSASRLGSSRFHRSLSPIGTMTSLNNGFASRDTWVKGPDQLSRCSSWYRPFCRCADAHTPITAARSMGLVGAFPLRVNLLIGTWIAMVCTLNARNPFTPPVAGVGIRCRFWNGRRTARSNTAPRST